MALKLIMYNRRYKGDSYEMYYAKGRKSSHMDENVKAGDLVLDKDDAARMRKDVEKIGSPE